jgi:hypothetical protein
MSAAAMTGLPAGTAAVVAEMMEDALALMTLDPFDCQEGFRRMMHDIMIPTDVAAEEEEEGEEEDEEDMLVEEVVEEVVEEEEVEEKVGMDVE